MKSSIGGRLKGREKAERGKTWNWIKSKMKRHILLLHWRVQDSDFTFTARRDGAQATR